MIKLQCIGHLGKDAVLNTLENGKTVINFSIAHTEKYQDNEKTIWVSCAYWSEKTGILPYLKKGQQVYAEGFPDVEIYQGKQGTGATLKLKVMTVQLLGGKPSEGTNGSAPQQQSSAPVNSATNTSASRKKEADSTQKSIPTQKSAPTQKSTVTDEPPMDDLPF